MYKLKLSQKTQDFIWGIIFTILCMAFIFFAGVLQSPAQSVTRQGNVFYQDTTASKSKIAKDDPTLTPYWYVTHDGKKHPIYMSSTGKCFIIRTSKNGKRYRQYLPEVTKQLSK